MSVLLTLDPGPLARFHEIAAEENTMPVIVQRLTSGESLKEIAAAWKVPYGRLAQWVVEDRGRAEQYTAALEIWADSLAQETVAIADAADETRDAVAKAKLQADVRLKLAGKLHRKRYGDSQEVRHTGSVSLVSILSGMPKGGEVIDVTPETTPRIENVHAKNSAENGLI